MLKESRLIKKKRTTRGGGKKDRTEWALVSKTNGRVLKWFGPTKPSKDQVAKEERRVHSFADDVSIYMEKTSGVKLVDSPGRKKRIEEMWRKEEKAQEEREAAYQEAMKEDRKHWTKNALPELTKWNQEFIKNYAPGTANAKRIAPLISAFPSPIYQEMKDKSPEEKYKWFYENKFNNRLTLNIPGQTGRLNLEWEPKIRDEHGARGLFMGGDNFPGKWLMQLDPGYWFTTTPNNRKKLLFHELEHAMSGTIGEQERSNIVREKDPYVTPGFGQYTGSNASNITEQVPHYEKVFSILNMPKWIRKLMEEEHTSSLKGGVQTIVPINFAWANRRDEQRSVLKTFLSKHGGVMTPELLNGLCKEKERSGKFDWKKSTSDEKIAFIKTFGDNGFRLDVLIYLNCTDKDKVLNHINSIVKADSTGGQRVMTASIDNDLFILSKSLFKQGFGKEAEQVRLLIK
jgi:hypothetical protein